MKSKFKDQLDPQQLLAVEAPIGNNCVFAIAGSGKTRTLTYRVANMIDNNIPEKNILLLTFTKKAANEMTERIKSLLGREELFLMSGTFHSVAAKFLRRYHYLVRLSRNFTILDQNQAKKLISKIRKSYMKENGIEELPKDATVQAIISGSINHSISMEDYTRKYVKGDFSQKELEHLEAISIIYKKKKIEANSVDFDDLMILFLEVLQNKKAQGEILQEVKHILVDEYQDINPTQDEILKKLSSGSMFVIGDPAQCIYQFRGSNQRYIGLFEKDYENVIKFQIAYNYRSTPEVLALAESSIQNNDFSEEIFLNTKNSSGDLPFVVGIGDSYSQAASIAKTIESHYMDNLNEVAILVRRRSEMIELNRAFMERGIPHRLVGGMSLLETAHVRKFLSILDLISNPFCEGAFIETATMFEKVGDVSAAKIFASYKNILSGKEDKQKLNENQKNALNKILYLVSLREEPCAKIIKKTYESFFQSYILDAYEDYKKRMSDIQYLIEYAEKVDEDLELFDFIAGIKMEASEIEEEEEEEEKKDAVTIITMHRSKGLEWDYVFIPNFTDKIFPILSEGDYFDDNGEFVQNERNLLYVAITRAKKDLYFYYTTKHPYYQNIETLPSPFIQEFKRGSYEKKLISEGRGRI